MGGRGRIRWGQTAGGAGRGGRFFGKTFWAGYRFFRSLWRFGAGVGSLGGDRGGGGVFIGGRLGLQSHIFPMRGVGDAASVVPQARLPDTMQRNDQITALSRVDVEIP